MLWIVFLNTYKRIQSHRVWNIKISVVHLTENIAKRNENDTALPLI